MSVDPDLAAILDNEGPSDEAVVDQPEPAEADLHAEPEAPAESEAPADAEHAETGSGPTKPLVWEDYVKLRQENAEYRGKWQPIEKAFEGVHPDDAEALLNLVRTYASNPTEAAGLMRQYADALAANDGEAVLDDEGAAPEPKYLTADDLNRVLSEREQRAAQAQAVEQIQRDAESLGYNPESEDYVALLSIASKNGGDLQAAHKAMTAKRQSIIDEYLKAKAAESNGTPAPQMGVTPSGENQIASLKDADKAAWDLLTQQ